MHETIHMYHLILVVTCMYAQGLHITRNMYLCIESLTSAGCFICVLCRYKFVARGELCIDHISLKMNLFHSSIMVYIYMMMGLEEREIDIKT